MPDVFVGRQAIHNRKLDVVGYEILLNSNDRSGSIDDLDVGHVLVDIGITRLAGNKDAHVGATRDTLLSGSLEQFPPDRTVVQVPFDFEPDEEMLAALHRVKEAGYGVAISGFADCREASSLLDVATFAKVDAAAMEKEQLIVCGSFLNERGITAVAGNVETYNQLRTCKTAGFEYFQGAFLCKPEVVEGRNIEPSSLAALKLVASLQDPDVKIDEIANLISTDVALSHKLLRTVNSPFYALPREVDSIHEAVVMIGLRQIARWASLMKLSAVGNKPTELTSLAMVRAKMCELVAERLGRTDQQLYFTVGLFSVLDALTDAPMERVVAELPLSDSVVEALVDGEGVLGATLTAVVAYEQGEWKNVEVAGMSEEKLTQAFLDAIEWSDEMYALMGA